jgi:hypothetical protein
MKARNQAEIQANAVCFPGRALRALRLFFVLLHSRFFARRARISVGQVANLRPIGNRPAPSTHECRGPFAACRYVGQVVNLRAIGNRPAASTHECRGPFAACRYVGQVVNLRPIGNRPSVSTHECREPFAACGYVGQVVNLRPIGNRPSASTHDTSKKRPLRLRLWPLCGAACQPNVGSFCDAAFPHLLWGRQSCPEAPAENRGAQDWPPHRKSSRRAILLGCILLSAR